jgi:hypothetical protein
MQVYNFLNALASRDAERLQPLLSEDAALYWGPYRFEGRDRILTWARELFDLFPFMVFKEKGMEIHGQTAKHEFLIAFLTPDGRRGWLPCIGLYEFKGDLISRLKIILQHGFLTVSRREIERVKPNIPEKQ